MPVAHADNRRRRLGAGPILGCPASFVTLAAKRSLQLGFADAGAHPCHQRVKPVVAEKKRRLDRTRGWRCDICGQHRRDLRSPEASTCCTVKI